MKMRAIMLAVLGLTAAMAASAQEFVGQKMPALDLKYLEDAPVLTGKPILLEFWATWCPPCRKSIPHLNELYAKYKDQGLVIIGVTNEKKDVVEKFLKGLPINYTVAFDSSRDLSKHFKIRGIPHALLANAEGEIVWQGHPMGLREAEIEKVLQKPAAATP